MYFPLLSVVLLAPICVEAGNLCGTSKDKQQRTKSEETSSGHHANVAMMVASAPSYGSWKEQKIKLRKQIGYGASGIVWKATSRNKTVCAVKKIPKENTNIERIVNEIELQRKLKSMFIVQLLNAFQDPYAYYLQLEFVEGGDLSELMHSRGKFSESTARFYAAEILCGLEFIHNNDIIFRDLKPDNILLTSEGHIKIADFGFAKQLGNDEIRDAICGTPGYMAPEILQGEQHTKSVDFWSLGVVIYAMIVGFDQFEEDSPLQPFDLVPNNSSGFPKIAKNLLTHLLDSEPTRRYNLSQTKKHLWFIAIDWEEMENQRCEPPLKPY